MRQATRSRFGHGTRAELALHGCRTYVEGEIPENDDI
jgi:hypothetical protein